jgi:hypothetical protein
LIRGGYGHVFVSSFPVLNQLSQLSQLSRQ